MTAPSNANTSGLEVVAWLGRVGPEEDATFVTQDPSPHPRHPETEYEPLVTAASAQARIAELEAENDVLKVEVIGLRAAIFGSHDYDPSLRHGNFVEMARATEDGRQGALARATAAEARADRLAEIASKLSAAISWLDYPFIDNRTPEAELRQRVGFMMKDAEPHRAALQQETQP